MSTRGDFPLTFRLQVQGDQEVANKFKNVATSMQQISPAATKASQSTKQVDTSLKTTSTSANTASTGLKNYTGAMQGFGSSNTQARSSVEGFTGALNRFSTENTRAVGGLNQTNTVAKGLVPTMGNMGNETNKTKSKMQSLTDTFRGNRGLIFSVTMLSSGIFEAIGMFQGYQDAAEKLANAQEKVNDLEAQGLEHTKEYGDATRELADAQRGFNFIQRFTIQSFADLIPMGLMFTSSILEMTSKMGGMATMKTKLAAGVTKLTSAMRGLFAATMAFTLRHPLLLLLTALVGVALAVITNFMGVRDALNQFGVALGNAIGPLKGVLEWLGMIGNGVADTANSYLQFGTVAVEASTDVEKQVLKTGDATQLSFQEQINIMNKFGEEAKNLTFSVGAHLLKQQQEQEAHKNKYAQFVQAMTSGDEEIMQSLKLTADEYKTFYDEWQQELEAFDDKFNESVDNITSNWDTVKERGADAATSLIEDIDDTIAKIVELTHESWDMEDEELDRTQEKIDQLTSKLADLQGSVSETTLQGARDFVALGQAGKQGLDAISLGILSQDFQGAISGLSTAIDSVPAKYQSNFSEIDKIIGNTALTNRQKVAQIISDYGSLEKNFKPLISGAYELSRADAELASNFDELSVAARSNMTNMNQAEGAWNTFLASLTPAQKQLPMIQDIMARLKAGTIDYGQALTEVEAHGRDFSQMLGKDMMTSIKDVQKSFIDLGDGTSAMVANVNGQMVNLGRVSNTELGNVSNDLNGVQTSMGDTAKTAKTEIANEATAAVGVLGKDGKIHFATVVKGANDTIDVFKVVNSYADTYIAKGAGGKVGGFAETMKSTGKINKTETDQWAKDFENFKTEAVKWLGQVQTKLDSLWKSAQERLNNTNFQNLLPNFGQEASGDEGKGQVNLNQAKQMMGMGGGFGIPAKIDTDISPAIAKLDQLKAYANTTTTQISSFFLTMESSIKLTLTRIGTLGTVGFTPLQTAATQVTSQASASFVVMETSIKGTMTRIAAIFPTAFTTLYTYAQQNAGLAIGSFVTMEQGITQTMSRITLLFAPAFANLGPIASQATSLASAAFVTMESSIKGTLSRITAAFAPAFAPLHPAANKATSMTSASFVTMNTSIKGSLDRTTASINSFTSNAVSQLKKVASAADAARSAFNRMASAAKAAERAARSAMSAGAGSFQHGGSAVLMGQRGFSGVVNKPTTIGSGLNSVNVGEGFESEFVSVTPLNKGTGNHTGNLKRASMGGAGGGSSPNSINAQFIIVLDGREMKRFVQKVALDSTSSQI